MLLTGGSVMIRILLFVLAVVILLAVGKTAYSAGCSLFAATEEGGTSGAQQEFLNLMGKLTGRGTGDGG